MSSSSAEETRHSEYALQLASASVLPMALKSAIEMGLLDVIAKAGPNVLLSASEIAAHLHSTNPEFSILNSQAPCLLDQVLALLASHSILTCSLQQHEHHGQRQVSRLYGLAPVAKYFIPNEDGVSFATMLLMIQDKAMVDMWHHLKDAVLEGGLPFNRAYGMNSFEYVHKDGRLAQLFNSCMKDYNTMFLKKVLEDYGGFKGLNSMVDVGGGDGSLLTMIVSKYPSIKAINFDLPHVVQKAPSYPGIEHVGGDMFVSIPKADAIFMKWILHTWDDEHCLKILRNCYESLGDGENGKVIVVDMVVPEDPETSVAAQMGFQYSLFLTNMNPGGKERTLSEFQRLAKAAGFSTARLPYAAYNLSVVEFYKA